MSKKENKPRGKYPAPELKHPSHGIYKYLVNIDLEKEKPLPAFGKYIVGSGTSMVPVYCHRPDTQREYFRLKNKVINETAQIKAILMADKVDRIINEKAARLILDQMDLEINDAKKEINCKSYKTAKIYGWSLNTDKIKMDVVNAESAKDILTIAKYMRTELAICGNLASCAFSGTLAGQLLFDEKGQKQKYIDMARESHNVAFERYHHLLYAYNSYPEFYPLHNELALTTAINKELEFAYNDSTVPHSQKIKNLFEIRQKSKQNINWKNKDPKEKGFHFGFTCNLDKTHQFIQDLERENFADYEPIMDFSYLPPLKNFVLTKNNLDNTGNKKGDSGNKSKRNTFYLDLPSRNPSPEKNTRDVEDANDFKDKHKMNKSKDNDGREK